MRAAAALRAGRCAAAARGRARRRPRRTRTGIRARVPAAVLPRATLVARRRLSAVGRSLVLRRGVALWAAMLAAPAAAPPSRPLARLFTHVLRVSPDDVRARRPPISIPELWFERMLCQALRRAIIAAHEPARDPHAGPRCRPAGHAAQYRAHGRLLCRPHEQAAPALQSSQDAGDREAAACRRLLHRPHLRHRRRGRGDRARASLRRNPDRERDRRPRQGRSRRRARVTGHADRRHRFGVRARRFVRRRAGVRCHSRRAGRCRRRPAALRHRARRACRRAREARRCGARRRLARRHGVRGARRRHRGSRRTRIESREGDGAPAIDRARHPRRGASLRHRQRRRHRHLRHHRRDGRHHGGAGRFVRAHGHRLRQARPSVRAGVQHPRHRAQPAAARAVRDRRRPQGVCRRSRQPIREGRRRRGRALPQR